MKKRNGKQIADWIELAGEVEAATTPKAARSLVAQTNGWPIIIDLDEYADETKTKELDKAVNKLKKRVDALRREGNDDLADEMEALLDVFMAT